MEKRMKNNIKEIIGREIIDSRGNPTVEVDVVLQNGSFGRASVPSGASTGSHEAVEMRDSGKRFSGKGVMRAVKNINTEIRKSLINENPMDQERIDSLIIELDGTTNKSRLGGNATLGVSLAVARAAAYSSGRSLYHYLSQSNKFNLPVPLMNVLNGGQHADNTIDFQEFMIMPVGASSLKEAVQKSCEVFHKLKINLNKKGLSTNVGDEGGFAPEISSAEEAIELILKAINSCGYIAEKDFVLALDCAATEYHKDQKYILTGEDKVLSSEEKVVELQNLCDKYPIFSIEDGMAEDDWKGWTLLTSSLGKKTQLVGDDLFVTNVERLQKGINEKVANAILIKPNQIGTLTETIATITLARKNGYQCVMSHRSGETEDTFIADLAVATNCSQIKAGSLSRTDRLAKYNQLIRIEEELKGKSNYVGDAILTDN
tara:strand:- start:1266 stop:2558 length:1293 start_codon:yes stop_codon:yes gene_type:complete